MSETTQEITQIKHIGNLIKAKIGLIWVTTHEENRFIHELYHSVVRAQQKEMWTWSAYEGIKPYDSTYIAKQATGDFAKTQPPNAAITKITEYKGKTNKKGSVWILKDFHTVLTQPIPRQIKDVINILRKQRKTLIIVSPSLAHGAGGTKAGIEPTLEKEVTVIDYRLPARSHIHQRCKAAIDKFKKDQEELPKEKRAKVDYTEEDYNKFSIALQGLTAQEIDGAVRTSLVALEKLDEKLLVQQKKQVIQRADILEYVGRCPTMADVGGLDAAKEYLSTYNDQFSQEAQEYGVEPLRGILMVGVPGCVAGSTMVKYNRGRRPGFREITVENLYKKFNQFASQNCWDPEIPTSLYSFDGEGKISKNRLLGVTSTGTKNFVKVVVTLEDGNEKRIKLTADHPICKVNGEYIEAGKLKYGDKVLIQGSMKPRFNGGKKIKLRPKRKTIETLKYHPLAPQHEVNGYIYQRENYARLVIEAHMNGLTPVELTEILKTDPEKSAQLKYLPSRYDVHHIDENPLNDEISNLMVIEHENHARLHSKLENFNVDYLQDGTVIDVIEWGSGPAYDIQMEYPNNNFIANEFIVHNTGKSLLAKAVASQWELPLIRLDVGKVMSGLVGSSEARMRDAIAQVEAVSPVILWIDEIEKSLSGTKSSNHSDGGTLARVFGTLLTAMEESMEGVVVIATSNDIQSLPPELIRRFNEVLFVDLPVPVEREEIFKIHFQKRGRDPKKLKLKMKELVASTHNFTGSEIEKIVKESIARAFQKRKKNVTQKDVLEAIDDTKPISHIMKDKIDAIVEWARGKARYASSLAEAARAPGAQKVTTSGGKELDLAGELDDLDEVMVDKKADQDIIGID